MQRPTCTQQFGGTISREPAVRPQWNFMSPRAAGAGPQVDHWKSAYRGRGEENHDRRYGGYPGIVANNRLSGMSPIVAVQPTPIRRPLLRNRQKDSNDRVGRIAAERPSRANVCYPPWSAVSCHSAFHQKVPNAEPFPLKTRAAFGTSSRGRRWSRVGACRTGPAQHLRRRLDP